MTGSRLDHVYRSLLQTKFFRKGWGKPDNLKRLFEFRKVVSKRETCYKLVQKDHPVTIIKEEVGSEITVLEGRFVSPFVEHLPGLLPPEAETVYFQVVLPKKWRSEHYKPVCLHLAGTGDHGFWRRRQMMVKPLLKEAGIAGIILENPFYGLRKPKDQIRSNLNNVSDIFVMGGCLILESLALFHWCERVGLGPLGITGMSMGGHMASLAATSWPKPLVLVPCLSWSTASPVFTKGVMSDSINWSLLQNQYLSDEVYKQEIRNMVQTNQYAFRAGQHFAQNYPQSLSRIQELNSEKKQKDVLVKDDLYYTSHCSKIEDKGENLNPSDVKVTKQYSTTCSSDLSGNGAKSNSSCLDGEPAASPVDKHISIEQPPDLHRHDAVDGNIRMHNGGSVSKQTGFFSLDFVRKKNVESLLSHFTTSKENILGGPELKSSGKPLGKSEIKNIDCSGAVLAKWRENEALQFMRGIMDECTHLRNFDVPADTSLIIAVCASKDAYVPREGSAHLADIWPGAEVRYVDAGHVTAYLLYQHAFRKAIIESFERWRRKYSTS
ncbi:protein ABHD18 [Bacillus rossius redtenbacheri]|uniref:protein ABHD18 n=1 Tax=Bacillus rossius redtenbacheri TaxID=93214 RepID=UPI002FDE7135